MRHADSLELLVLAVILAGGALRFGAAAARHRPGKLLIVSAWLAAGAALIAAAVAAMLE